MAAEEREREANESERGRRLHKAIGRRQRNTAAKRNLPCRKINSTLYHNLVFDEIIVETDFLSFVCS